MLRIQEYLHNTPNTIEQLNETLGISAKRHPTLPLYIFNYSQIDSPKTHPIVREARGLILEEGSWNIVAKGFNRFFNWGEVLEEQKLFNWGNCLATEKVDGSYINLFFYDNQWRMSTRNSWGYDFIQFTDKLWVDYVFDILKGRQKYLSPYYSYVFEFVSPETKIVRHYKEPSLYLLTAYDKQFNKEVDYNDLGRLFKTYFNFPTMYSFNKYSEVEDALREKEKSDPTFEGFVIRDDKNNRWKVKNRTYLSYHKMRGEGQNLYNPKYWVPFILSGESSELLSIFPEIKDKYLILEEKVKKEYESLKLLMNETKDIENQKEFALAIKDRTKFSSILFRLKGQNNLTEDALKREWREKEELIIKIFLDK